MQEYLVPRAVTSRFEIFPGFGFSELGAVSLGGLVGFVLQWLVYLLPLSTAVQTFGRLFLFTLPSAAALMLVKQDISGYSLWSQLKAMRKWNKSQKVYKYARW